MQTCIDLMEKKEKRVRREGEKERRKEGSSFLSNNVHPRYCEYDLI
jgi:hypothetical protein